MADLVHFELVSPERLLLSTDVDMVVVPGVEGDFGVLPGHMPVISSIRPGVITIYRDGKVDDRIFVEGGFAEVTPEGCTILAEHALPISDINREAAQQMAQDAREDIAEAKNDEERNEATQALLIAEARLQALEPPAYS